MLPRIVAAFSAEEMPEEIAQSKIVQRFEPEGRSPLISSGKRTRLESTLLTRTLSRLIREKKITTHSEKDEVMYQLTVKD